MAAAVFEFEDRLVHAQDLLEGSEGAHIYRLSVACRYVHAFWCDRTRPP